MLQTYQDWAILTFSQAQRIVSYSADEYKKPTNYIQNYESGTIGQETLGALHSLTIGCLTYPQNLVQILGWEFSILRVPSLTTCMEISKFQVDIFIIKYFLA